MLDEAPWRIVISATKVLEAQPLSQNQERRFRDFRTGFSVSSISVRTATGIGERVQEPQIQRSPVWAGERSFFHGSHYLAAHHQHGFKMAYSCAACCVMKAAKPATAITHRLVSVLLYTNPFPVQRARGLTRAKTTISASRRPNPPLG